MPTTLLVRYIVTELFPLDKLLTIRALSTLKKLNELVENKKEISLKKNCYPSFGIIVTDNRQYPFFT